jgi:hypothetical protein
MIGCCAFCFRRERTKTKLAATIGNKLQHLSSSALPSNKWNLNVSVPNRPDLNFSDTLDSLRGDQICVFEHGSASEVPDLAHATFLALQQPLDFPPLAAAIVPGDRVALAVDPNTPGVVEIIRGVLRALDETEASAVDIVVWDEANDQTVAAIQHEIGERTRVVRHESSDRASLRYLGADQDADPVYLNRRLVDADLVLPIATGRPLDADVPHDITGVFPFFADSASRARHRRNSFASNHSKDETLAHATQACQWLGAQFMLCAIPNQLGRVRDVFAGTPDAIRKRLASVQPDDSEYPPTAPLLIASLDGGIQQQTWANAARGFTAAARYAVPGGTIVLWTEMQDLPSGCLLELGGEEPIDFDARADDPIVAEDEFPAWDASNGIARVIQRVAANHRLLIRSKLEDEVIESVGLAAIGNPAELNRLISGVESCAVLPAAQFAGTTADIAEQKDE